MQKITISTEVNVNIKNVWDCYTDPKHIIHWNFASPDWICPKASNNLQVGGIYKARMEAKDGSFGFDFEGVYSKVQTHKLLVLVLEDGRNVEISFVSKNQNSTEIKIIFDPENQNPIEMQEAGWLAILLNYKKYTEGLQ